MDGQKVLTFPHLPGIKTILLTRSIIRINPSIAPLSSFKKANGTQNKNKKKPVGVLWHKSIQGHRDEDGASIVTKFSRYPCY